MYYLIELFTNKADLRQLVQLARYDPSIKY